MSNGWCYQENGIKPELLNLLLLLLLNQLKDSPNESQPRNVIPSTGLINCLQCQYLRTGTGPLTAELPQVSRGCWFIDVWDLGGTKRPSSPTPLSTPEASPTTKLHQWSMDVFQTLVSLKQLSLFIYKILSQITGRLPPIFYPSNSSSNSPLPLAQTPSPDGQTH